MFKLQLEFTTTLVQLRRSQDKLSKYNKEILETPFYCMIIKQLNKMIDSDVIFWFLYINL